MSGIPVGARDLKVDKGTGDLVIEESDFAWVTELDAIEQDIRTAFKMFLGEYFLDLLSGIPWRQKILGQKPDNLPAIREIFRKQLIAIPGVKEVLSIDVTFDTRTRKVSAPWQVSTDFGELKGTATT